MPLSIRARTAWLAATIVGLVALFFVAGGTNPFGSDARTYSIPGKTITYSAPPEPVSGTSTTTNTIPHPQPVVEPGSFTPLPVAPQPQPVEPKKPDAPDSRAVLDQECNRAIALSDSQQWREAASAWERLLREHSGRNRAFDSGAWHRLGVAYEALSEWSKAATAFQQANLNDDRNNATSDLRHMGHCYIKLGRRSEAMDIYKRLLAIDPGDKTSKDLLSALSRER